MHYTYMLRCADNSIYFEKITFGEGGLQCI